MLRAALFVAASMAVVGGAQAETLRPFKIGPWHGGAYTSESTNRFSHCGAMAPYYSGVAMAFIVTRQYQWSIAFVSETFGLEKGRNIRVCPGTSSWIAKFSEHEAD
jgi:hypothetical protein